MEGKPLPSFGGGPSVETIKYTKKSLSKHSKETQSPSTDTKEISTIPPANKGNFQQTAVLLTHQHSPIRVQLTHPADTHQQLYNNNLHSSQAVNKAPVTEAHTQGLFLHMETMAGSYHLYRQKDKYTLSKYLFASPNYLHRYPTTTQELWLKFPPPKFTNAPITTIRPSSPDFNQPKPWLPFQNAPSHRSDTDLQG